METNRLPDRIRGLADLASNLSWSWNRRARSLFRSIDLTSWQLTRHNPVEFLRRVEQARLVHVARQPEFLRRYDAVYQEFRRYLSASETWFASAYPELTDGPVAYFCAEFGLHNSVPIYSGGLGVLAGDHLKAASDLGVPLVGVGLCYTRGYFDQRLRLDGWQQDADQVLDLRTTPLERILGPHGEPYVAVLEACGHPVHLGVLRMAVGRVPVYLLDTDVEVNHPEVRALSHRLYAGGRELRLKQEWILGAGGVRVLRALGIAPATWHANEGHAAFMLVERLRELTCGGVPLDEAVPRVRATSVFTTHTPVPAGHDVFTPGQLEQCAGPIWDELGVSRDRFLALGRHPDLDHGAFHMTALAIRLSERVNGVSRRHGEITRDMWRLMWPDREVRDVPIRHVTNGVHLQTWMSYYVKRLLDEHLGPEWASQLDEPGLWEAVLDLDDVRLWEVHTRLKRDLMDFIDEEARRNWRERWDESAHLVGAGTLLSPDALTIGFARRFAAYKRAALPFRDVERLRRLVINPWRPVQFIFAGKAHPADEQAKQVLQAVYAFTRDPRFEGRIAFLEDYEMHLAHRLVQGVDLWLNLPRIPLEACGTSGIKAALNAVPQLGTADGWWAEGFTGRNGWSIPPAVPRADADEAEAERLYTLLEREVVPLFYDRDERGVPLGWVRRMKHALRVAAERFSARRMVQEYVRDYYVPCMREAGSSDSVPLLDTA